MLLLVLLLVVIGILMATVPMDERVKTLLWIVVLLLFVLILVNIVLGVAGSGQLHFPSLK